MILGHHCQNRLDETGFPGTGMTADKNVRRSGKIMDEVITIRIHTECDRQDAAGIGAGRALLPIALTGIRVFGHRNLCTDGNATCFLENVFPVTDAPG